MIIYSILLFNKSNEIISEAYYLYNFGYFERNTVKEFIIFFSKLVLSKCNINTETTINHNNYVIYCFKNLNNTCCIVCDKEYPKHTAFNIISDILNNQYNTCYIEMQINEYQNPTNINKIYKIQGELTEIKSVLHITINNLLERGEKLEDIVEKSNQLSYASKEFYKKTKNSNCCFIS